MLRDAWNRRHSKKHLTQRNPTLLVPVIFTTHRACYYYSYYYYYYYYTAALLLLTRYSEITLTW